MSNFKINGNIAGFELTSGARVSFDYLVNK
jgi:hypothetical protein